MSDIHLEGRSCYLVPHRKDQVLSKFGKKKKRLDWFCSLRKKRNVVSLAKGFLDDVGMAA